MAVEWLNVKALSSSLSTTKKVNITAFAKLRDI
jgi:hypothetical protein